jgi:hypothetical protein
MTDGKELFKSGAQLPSYLDGEMDDVTKAIVGTGGTGGKRISIRGSVFRQVIDGKETEVNENRFMNLVVVSSSVNVHRTYYKGKYSSGEFQAPVCWSEDGKVPVSTVVDKQSTSCATCEMNIAGSGQGTTRACRFSRRIAVVLEGDMGGNVYSMSLPAKSLFGKGEAKKLPFEAYVRFLATNKVPVTAVVTEARFNPKESVPVLIFKPIRPLKEEEWKVCSAQKETEDAKQAVAIPKYANWADNGDDPETHREEEAPKKRTTIDPVPVMKDKIESTLEGWDD